MISKGFDLVTIGSDQRFMSAGAKAAIESIKDPKRETQKDTDLSGLLCLYAQI